MAQKFISHNGSWVEHVFRSLSPSAECNDAQAFQASRSTREHGNMHHNISPSATTPKFRNFRLTGVYAPGYIAVEVIELTGWRASRPSLPCSNLLSWSREHADQIISVVPQHFSCRVVYVRAINAVFRRFLGPSPAEICKFRPGRAAARKSCGDSATWRLAWPFPPHVFPFQHDDALPLSLSEQD